MQPLPQWVTIHLTKPACFFSLQIILGLASAYAAEALLGHFQALGDVAADPISHHIGGQILHSVPVLAKLSVGLHVNSLSAPLAGVLVGTLLTMIGKRPQKTSAGSH
jgi:hypothetical protein